MSAFSDTPTRCLLDRIGEYKHTCSKHAGVMSMHYTLNTKVNEVHSLVKPFCAYLISLKSITGTVRVPSMSASSSGIASTCQLAKFYSVQRPRVASAGIAPNITPRISLLDAAVFPEAETAERRAHIVLNAVLSI